MERSPSLWGRFNPEAMPWLKSACCSIVVLLHIFLFLFFLVGWDLVSWYCGQYWPIVPAPDDDRWWWLRRNWWNGDWQVKQKYSAKTCPSATLSTTNSTWLDPGLNPGRRGGKPATNRLSYGAALLLHHEDEGRCSSETAMDVYTEWRPRRQHECRDPAAGCSAVTWLR
jgi:hypothetical protein